MKYFKRLANLSVFPLMIGVSLVVGRLIPAFYDWSGADQSRPSPLIFQTAIGVFLCGIMAWLALPWMHLEYDLPATNRVGKGQFTIRVVLAITAAIGVFLAVFRIKPMLAVGSLLLIAMCYVVRFGIRFRSVRWPVASLLACMFFPFAWIVTWNDLINDFRPEMLWMVSGLPAFYLTMLDSSLVSRHYEDSIWLLTLLTSAELLVGVWLIRLGPRRFAAYLVAVLLASIFGSLLLNALVRI